MNRVMFGDETSEGVIPVQREHRRMLFGDKERNIKGLDERVDLVCKRVDRIERKDIFRMGYVAGASAIGGIVGGFLFKIFFH